MYDGSTALILAARMAVEGMVEELITCHADVNAVDELGKGPPTSPRPPPLVLVPRMCSRHSGSGYNGYSTE